MRKLKACIFFKALAMASVIIITWQCTASALLLEGKNVEYTYFYNDFGEIYNFSDSTPRGDYGTDTVSSISGPEVTDIVNNKGTLDYSDTNLLVEFTDSGLFSSPGPDTFSGWIITDVDGTIDAFTSVTIAGTDLSGFTASMINWDDNNIWINWIDMSFESGQFLSLDINGGVQPVPEPTTMLLLGSGLVGLALYGRRRFRKEAGKAS